MLLSFVFCAFTLIGCQSPKEEMSILDPITSISISKSNGYGGLTENYIVSINKKEIVSNIEEVMKSAKRKGEDVNKEKPDYDVLVQYEDGSTHGLHLFMGNEEEESVFMYIGHEETTFYVNQMGTKKLRQIINTEDINQKSN